MGELNSVFPTGKDIAKQAGVSVTTVSRVINDRPNVRPEVREKVLSAVKSLNYHPNRTARRLRAKRSNVIGLIIPDIQNPFYTSIARGIEDTASELGYSVLLCNTDENRDKERQYIDVLCAEEVAGVILATTGEESEHVNRLGNCRIPVIAIDRLVKKCPMDAVLVSNREGVCTAISHLLDLGHTRIGFIGLPRNLTVGSERYQGYRDALKKRGLKPAKELVRIGDARQLSGYQCASELLDLRPAISALFVANNLMTLGTLDALDERGMAVPERISLISFDDMPLAAYLNPPLTTVSQPTYQIGQTAARLLLERIANANRPFQHVRLHTTLVIRSSTSAPAQQEVITRE